MIAVDIPNIAGVRHDPWTKYLVSVNQLEAATGLDFFTALAPAVAQILKAKIDGQPMPVVAATEATATTEAATAAGSPPAGAAPAWDWVPIALGVVIILLVLCIVVGVLVFRMRPKR